MRYFGEMKTLEWVHLLKHYSLPYKAWSAWSRLLIASFSLTALEQWKTRLKIVRS